MPDLQSEYLGVVPGNLQVNILTFKLENHGNRRKAKMVKNRNAIISMIDGYNKCHVISFTLIH